MKLHRVTLLACCLSLANGLFNPFSHKFEILNTKFIKLSFETDYFLGSEFKHRPKPSEFAELSDEFDLDFRFNQWIKFDFNLLDNVVDSRILEMTWFEFMPLAVQTYTEQAESLPNLIMNFDMHNILEAMAYVRLFYSLDFVHFKVYHVQYPNFCTIDIPTLILQRQIINCGIGNDTQRIAPVHNEDPNINYSLMKFLLPQFQGKHEVFSVYLQDLLHLIKLRTAQTQTLENQLQKEQVKPKDDKKEPFHEPELDLFQKIGIRISWCLRHLPPLSQWKEWGIEVIDLIKAGPRSMNPIDLWFYFNPLGTVEWRYLQKMFHVVIYNI